MLQKNIDVTNSLVNGTIGIETEIKNEFDMKPDKIIVYFRTKDYQIERVCGEFEVFPGA